MVRLVNEVRAKLINGFVSMRQGSQAHEVMRGVHGLR